MNVVFVEKKKLKEKERHHKTIEIDIKYHKGEKNLIKGARGLLNWKTSHSGPRPYRWWEEEALIGEAVLQYRGSLGTWALNLEPKTSNNLFTSSLSEKTTRKCMIELKTKLNHNLLNNKKIM